MLIRARRYMFTRGSFGLAPLVYAACSHAGVRTAGMARRPLRLGKHDSSEYFSARLFQVLSTKAGSNGVTSEARLTVAVCGKCQSESVERLGDQVAAKWLPLFGITYDAKGDLLEIAMEGLDHLVHKPREIAVDDGPSGLGSMEIVDSDRRRQILKLMEPLLLPTPGSGTSAARGR
jgi:hypothetical protein